MIPVETINWEAIIINIVAAIPGIILAIATLIKIIKSDKILNEKTDLIQAEAVELKSKVIKVETAINGSKTIRAPRRSTDPVPPTEIKP